MMTLRELIKQRKCTQEKLAERVGVKQSSVSAWITGRTRPTTARLPKVAKALGVSVNTLVKCFEQGGNNDISA